MAQRGTTAKIDMAELEILGQTDEIQHMMYGNLNHFVGVFIPVGEAERPAAIDVTPRSQLQAAEEKE
jgi:hypothetical protein